MSGRSDVHVVRLRADHHHDPLGIGNARPRLSSQVETEVAGWTQAAYQIAIDSEAEPDRTVYSPQIRSHEQVLVPWPLPALGSRDRVRARVRVWTDEESEPSEWSRPLDIETGLLSPD